jgi:HlyD family secretion protein
VIFLLQQNARGLASDDEHPVEVLQAAALDAEADVVAREAELRQTAAVRLASQANLAAAVLRAPIDGVVVMRAVQPGETVQAGAPLFVVAADPARVQVIAPVGELDAAALQVGATMFEVPAHPGRRFDATSATLEPIPSASGAPYRLRLVADNADGALVPGMSATVMVASASARQALYVPTDAVSFAPAGGAADPGSAVHVVVDGHPRRVPVEIGVTDGRVVELRNTALRLGARVIVGER